MKSVRDWAFSHILSNSLVASRALSGSRSFSPEGTSHQESVDPGNRENQPHSSFQQASSESLLQSHNDDVPSESTTEPLPKIDELQIKFLRLVQRLQIPQSNVLVAKVLHRIHLGTLIRAGESDLKKINNRSDKLRALAAKQEANGERELDFSFRILVLGKTGVGKSATINSIFDERKTTTDAFRPATDCVQEVVGTVNGMKVSFIDTPGLLPSSARSMRKNREIMISVKRFIRKSPPDMVLFCERLDHINVGYGDLALLKLISEVLGRAVWFNTILVMTHCSILPEGPKGYSFSYESYIRQCTGVLQQYIHQTVSDSKIENPVLLVENHYQSTRNFLGEIVLPNGQIWKHQFLLLCICTKVLGDANNLLKFQDSIQLGAAGVSNRLPSLPHLLSSFFRHRPLLNLNGGDDEIDHILLSDIDEEDDYDRLPPIRMLNKAQLERLTEAQKKAYLDELDYRETLYLKKQMKEESLRRRAKEENLADDNNSDGQQETEAVLLPDMAVPPSFDSDSPTHKYRCLVTTDQWLARPVLDPHGWDHDVGFDGINLETAMEIRKNLLASITGQLSKDKHDFSIQSECAVSYINPVGPTCSAGLDVQSAGNELIYTVRSNTKLKSLGCNFTNCGISLASFNNNHFVGAKLEDTLLVGKKLKFSMNVGQMSGMGQVAYGGTFETTIRGDDYPVKRDHVSVSMTAVSFDKDTVVSGGFQSEFRPVRSMKVSVSGNLNSQKMGQICVKLSSFEHIEIGLIAVLSIFNAFCRKKRTEKGRETSENG